ncbi:energy-coupling factor ABC transporter ATP-binding protein [Shinella sp. BYT-45]|uniref:energy-coupling factor ABC transporter ATP-binding protein n=1 Tax=Shinella sp. BYT-45 TaxID=3377377 RepID=UPI003981440D
MLKNLSLIVRTGERIAILGANGSGKSTLGQLLAGWLTPNGGSVLWHDRPWRDHSILERTATVQLIGQIPAQHLSGRAFTVQEEIAFGPENLGLPAAEIIARRDRVLAACRLEALAERDPFTLSGGEQQRLVIAACLALEPSLLILDEPFTNLDPEARAHLAGILPELGETTTLILLDTNPDNALASADRILLLRDGQIALDGDPRTVLLDPACADVLGLPAIARAFQRLSRRALADLPLTLPEAAVLLKDAEPC